MGTSGNDKKLIETLYLEEVRRASSMLPSGDLVGRERPDFLLHAEGRTIGIEVTELCREEERAEGGKLSKVADRAKALYEAMADAAAVDVSSAFTPKARAMKFHELASSLAKFVYRNRKSIGSSYKRQLPKGYCHIGVFEPLNGRWRVKAAFDVRVATRELFADRIEEKNQRLPEYRVSAREVWLVVVNDWFLGHSAVYVRPEDVAEWRFRSDFDKVLLFSREPGGGGEVVEVQKEGVSG